MRLQDYDTSTRLSAVVVSSERITPDVTDEVREIVLDVDDTFDVEVGQSIGVLAPGQAEFGQRHHLRLYSIADLPEPGEFGCTRLRICVRRCTYIDAFNGEEYRGVASNYLCDLREGDELTVTGPYGLAFEAPPEDNATLILIGMGTGIAPFRAFVKHLYKNEPDFHGRILLFHGARSGIDMLYQNDRIDDFAQYYDEETFEAIAALSVKPHWSDSIAWDSAIGGRAEELRELLGRSDTYVYIAGLEQLREELDAAFAEVAAGEEKWARRKAELEAGGRWVELLY